MEMREKNNIVGHSATVDWNVGLNKSDTFVVWLDEGYLEDPACRLQAVLAREANKSFLIARKKGVEIPEEMTRGVDVVLIEDWETKEEMHQATHRLLCRLTDLDKKKEQDGRDEDSGA